MSMTGISSKDRAVRIFVYEYITGGGLSDKAVPASLMREGEVMAQALMRDLAELPGVEVLTTRDTRLPPVPERVEVIEAAVGMSAEALFRRGLEAADAVWPVAPESAGILETVSMRVLEAGRTLLGSRPDAIHVAASKHATSNALRHRDIATVATYLPGEAPAEVSSAWVVKPDDGVGCGEVRLFHRLANARRWLDAHRPPDAHAGFVLQPFVGGDACSLSLLCRDGAAVVLGRNRQRIAVRNDRFHYFGSVVNEITDPDGSLAALAQRIAAAIPGLWGYVGIDYIATGGGPVVMEVNPRVTTSYAGLRASLGVNPAAMVLALLDPATPLPAAPAPALKVDVTAEAIRA
jgi:predicted ATP-grasp superfamily ATP-dependent carboligase